MEITQELKEAKRKREEVVGQINQLSDQQRMIENQKQQLLQEALRIDGEVRLLDRLSKDGDIAK